MARAGNLLAVALLVAAGAADAGPWPREAGAWFVSLSGERDRDGNDHTGLYAEYGLTPRNTLGLQLGHSNAGETSALVWLQRALDRGKGADRFVVSAGLGAIERDDETLAVGQLGAGWGRGLDAVPLLRRIPGGGWLAAEAQLKVSADPAADPPPGLDAPALLHLTPETSAKAEITLGWNVTDRTMLINQLRLEERADTGGSGKLATTVAYELSGPASVEFGVVTPLSDDGEQAVKLGTWLRF